MSDVADDVEGYVRWHAWQLNLFVDGAEKSKVPRVDRGPFAIGVQNDRTLPEKRMNPAVGPGRVSLAQNPERGAALLQRAIPPTVRPLDDQLAVAPFRAKPVEALRPLAEVAVDPHDAPR